MTEERVLWRIKTVELEADGSCTLTITGQSLTWSNRTTCTTRISMPMELLVKHGLKKGSFFHGTCYYGGNGCHQRSEYHFEQQGTSFDASLSQKMQASVQRKAVAEWHERQRQTP